MNDRANIVEQRHTAFSEIRRLAVDVLYSEKGHFKAAAWDRGLHYVLAGATTVLAAAAGTALVYKVGSDVPLLLSFAATVLAALSTFVKSAEGAAKHHHSGVVYGHLRRRIRLFLVQASTSKPQMSDENMMKRLRSLSREVSRLQRDSPPIPQRAYEQAKKSIEQAKSADYTETEIARAVGETGTPDESSGRGRSQ